MTLDPVLAPDLDIIFCGINPASSAVLAGHAFSHPTNRFWAALHSAGFTDRLLAPDEERELLRYGCGLTAVVDRATRRADDLTRADFRAARAPFERRMTALRPRVLAFLGAAR
jgi:double-stranded uracil-DNA glycosylase